MLLEQNVEPGQTPCTASGTLMNLGKRTDTSPNAALGHAFGDGMDSR
jgi:hypothetical protein